MIIILYEAKKNIQKNNNNKVWYETSNKYDNNNKKYLLTFPVWILEIRKEKIFVNLIHTHRERAREREEQKKQTNNDVGFF